MAVGTKMWIATHTFNTSLGTVEAGRIVADGDPFLDEHPPPAFVAEGDPEPQPRWVRITLNPEPADNPVLEATANPGERRPTTRRKN